MRGERCIASNASIARIAKVSERSVMGALEKLEREGFIRRIYIGESRAKRSEIQCLVAFVKGEAQLTPGCSPLHPEGEVQLTRVVTTNNKKNNTLRQEPQQAFNSRETRQKWYEGQDEAFQLLAFFFDKKGLWKKFDTREKVTAVAKRHLRAARKIVAAGWSQQEVEKAIAKIPEKLREEWTLETAEKYLTK